MQSNKHLKLGGLIQLNLHELYESDAIDGIKDELEAMHGVKLEKSQTEDYITLKCENASEPLFCHYCVRFSTQFRIDRPSRMVLLLESFFVQHRQQCRNPDEANFLRNKHILNQNYQTIIKLVRRRYEDKESIKSPTHVLELLCQQEKLDINFLYEGLSNLETRRRIKKRFDNIIADAKKKCKQLIFSSGEKTKQDEEALEKKQETDSKRESTDQSTKKHEIQQQEQEQEGIVAEVTFKPLKKKIRKSLK